MTALKTTLFMMLVPGVMAIAFPTWLMQTDAPLFSLGSFRWLAIPFWIMRAIITIWCAWAFTVRGHGTPLPTDPPRELVVSGLYRYVRNPIYTGVLIFLLGHVFWHPSASILWMPLIVAFSSHLFVVLYEEPHLRKTFGAVYEQYCRDVPRWFPRVTAFRR